MRGCSPALAQALHSLPPYLLLGPCHPRQALGFTSSLSLLSLLGGGGGWYCTDLVVGGVGLVVIFSPPRAYYPSHVMTRPYKKQQPHYHLAAFLYLAMAAHLPLPPSLSYFLTDRRRRRRDRNRKRLPTLCEKKHFGQCDGMDSWATGMCV